MLLEKVRPIDVIEAQTARLSPEAKELWYQSSARPTRAARWAPRSQAGLRCERLPATQRGGAVREPTQAVARDRHPVREAGGQLPGHGGHHRADGLSGLVNHQTRPSLVRSPLLGNNAPWAVSAAPA